jgi:hypothetical protein
VKAWIHKFPTRLEEVTSYATTKPDDDEARTSESLERPWEQDDQVDQDGPGRSTTEEKAQEQRLKRWTTPAGIAVIRPEAGTGFRQAPKPQRTPTTLKRHNLGQHNHHAVDHQARHRNR